GEGRTRGGREGAVAVAEQDRNTAGIDHADGQVELAVAVEVAGTQAAAGASQGDRRACRGREHAAAGIEPDGYGLGVVAADRQVDGAVVVEVAGRHEVGGGADSVGQARAKAAVAVAETDGDVAAAVVGRGQVEFAVVVEVGRHGEREARRPAGGERRTRSRGE